MVGYRDYFCHCLYWDRRIVPTMPLPPIFFMNVGVIVQSVENHKGLIPLGHSNSRRQSSPKLSQNSLTAILMRLLPKRAGVLAFRPLESTRGILSFFTRILTRWTNCPPTSISHSKCFDNGT